MHTSNLPPTNSRRTSDGTHSFASSRSTSTSSVSPSHGEPDGRAGAGFSAAGGSPSAGAAGGGTSTSEFFLSLVVAVTPSMLSALRSTNACTGRPSSFASLPSVSFSRAAATSGIESTVPPRSFDDAVSSAYAFLLICSSSPTGSPSRRAISRGVSLSRARSGRATAAARLAWSSSTSYSTCTCRPLASSTRAGAQQPSVYTASTSSPAANASFGAGSRGAELRTGGGGDRTNAGLSTGSQCACGLLPSRVVSVCTTRHRAPSSPVRTVPISALVGLARGAPRWTSSRAKAAEEEVIVARLAIARPLLTVSSARRGRRRGRVARNRLQYRELNDGRVVAGGRGAGARDAPTRAAAIYRGVPSHVGVRGGVDALPELQRRQSVARAARRRAGAGEANH